MKNIISIILGSILSVANCFAQQTFNATGNTITNTTHTIDYSVGEMSFANFSNASNSVALGVVQPVYVISNSATGIYFDLIDEEIVVYPNPFSEGVTINKSTLEDYSYAVMDVKGAIVKQGRLSNYLLLQDLIVGQYTLSINNQSKSVKYFKLIKQ